MSTQDAPAPRDAGNWAAKVDRLHVDEGRGHGFNIEGRRLAGPQQGFGRLWQRTYTADLGTAVTPEALVADWRARFADYWPRMSRFYGGDAAIAPGDVAPLSGAGLTTGIMVLYADDTSFSFLTPEGHMFSAMITFSGERSGDGTLARIRILLRTSDPIFEAGWFGLRKGEDFMWPTVLRNLATAHGVPEVNVTEHTECIDRRRLWKNWRNVRHNSAIHSALHALGAPFRRREPAT